VSVLSLKAVDTAEVQALVTVLRRRLNRSAEPPVLVTAVNDLVCFRAETWQPILLARVEEALDELIGSAWRCGFAWA
jgi:hypothetical protein